MKAEIIKPYGVEVNYQIPETVEEFDALAKKKDAALEAAVKQELYHGSYGDIRAGVTEALIAQGHERIALAHKDVTNEETGETETIVTKWETDAKFLERICAELDTAEGIDLGAERFKDLIQKVADETPFDPSKTERVAKAKKIAKSHLTAAQEIAKEGALEGVASALSARLERPVIVVSTEEAPLTEDEAIENLARAIAENEAKEKKEAKSKYMDMVAG